MGIAEKSLEFMRPMTTYSDNLRFTAYAWGKLLYMQAAGDTEVAGYCITETEDPLLITDFKLIKQQCSSTTFDLDKDDMAEYQETILDMGLAVWQGCRILAHTHPPGCSPQPSTIDEENFRKVFTNPDWAVMLIIAENGDVYCRLKINTPPGTEKLLKVAVDWNIPFEGSNIEAWAKEYKEKVSKKTDFYMTGAEGKTSRKRLVPDDSLLDVFEEELGATREKRIERDILYADHADEVAGNSSEWWDDDEATWRTVSPEEKKKLEFEEMINEMDCWWDMDGDAVCCITVKGEDYSYYYNPDNDTWQLDNEDDFKPCAPPGKEGLDVKVRYWCKINEYCRPEMRKETV